MSSTADRSSGAPTWLKVVVVVLAVLGVFWLVRIVFSVLWAIVQLGVLALLVAAAWVVFARPNRSTR